VPPAAATPIPAPTPVYTSEPQSNYVEASVLSSAHRLVEEIKIAYSKVLQEKEEQISLLKEEVGDLKMLVRVLESQSSTGTKNLGANDLAPKEEYNSDNFYFSD